MKKRSALMVAAGLVFTLVVGGLAVAIGITGPTVSGGTPRAGRSVEPEVTTVKRTVTVHKKAKADGSSVVQATRAPDRRADVHALARPRRVRGNRRAAPPEKPVRTAAEAQPGTVSHAPDTT